MPQSVSWGKGRKAAFEQWFAQELHNALADRQGVERKWADWMEQYDAPRRAAADFPFPGASNEELPLTAMHFEPVLAQFIQSIHAPRNIWTAIDLSGQFTDSVNAITEYLTVIDQLFLKMRRVNQRAFPDLILLGTAAWHPTWLFERRKQKKYDENLNVITETVIINQPTVQHLPLGDFIWPANAWDIDPDAPVAPARWVGHRIKLTENQLRARAKGQEPFLPNYDSAITKTVLTRESEEEEIVEGKTRDIDELRPSFDRKIELFEIECRWDVDGDGIDEDVIVVWYQKMGVILRAIHNPWMHGKRLYEVEQYIKTFSLLGKGIASMDEMMQAVGSKILNAQIDNVLLANTRMFGFPQGAMIRPDEPIYPGKGWPLGPGEKIQEIKMGEVYPSLFQVLREIITMGEQRTSVSELRQGDISGLPSRTPATSVLSLLREGNKKFDMIMGNMRAGALANIGKRVFQMIAQRHQGGDSKWAALAREKLGEEDAAKVISALDEPMVVLEDGLGFEMTATSGQVNKEVEKQSLIGLAQFLAQAYPQMNQAAQLMGDQQLAAQTAVSTFNGGREVLMRLLEAFDIQNPERYLPPAAGQQGGAQPGAPGEVPQSNLGGPGGPQPLGADQLGALIGIGQ